MTAPVRRLRRLAAWTFGVTLLLVAIGGFTRGSGSGFGCQDRWPLCEDGLLGGLLPRPEFAMVVEWTHRWFAAISVALVAATVLYVWLRHREERALRWASSAALVAILVQAGLGAVVVASELAADLVSVHLGVAMVLLGLLAFVLVEAAFARGHRPAVSDQPDRTWRRLLALGAAGIYAVIVLGSLVHDRFVGPASFPDGWPLVGGSILPPTADATVVVHWSHRVAVLVVLAYLVGLARGVLRRGRPRVEVRLVHTALALVTLNVVLGAAHVFTRVQSTGLVVGHLLVAALAWSGAVAAAAVARRADGAATEVVAAPPATVGVPAGEARL